MSPSDRALRLRRLLLLSLLPMQQVEADSCRAAERVTQEKFKETDKQPSQDEREGWILGVRQLTSARSALEENLSGRHGDILQLAALLHIPVEA